MNYTTSLTVEQYGLISEEERTCTDDKYHITLPSMVDLLTWKVNSCYCVFYLVNIDSLLLELTRLTYIPVIWCKMNNKLLDRVPIKFRTRSLKFAWTISEMAPNLCIQKAALLFLTDQWSAGFGSFTPTKRNDQWRSMIQTFICFCFYFIRPRISHV